MGEVDGQSCTEREGVVGRVGEVGDDAVELVGRGGRCVCVRRVHDARVLRRRGGSRGMWGMTRKWRTDTVDAMKIAEEDLL